MKRTEKRKSARTTLAKLVGAIGPMMWKQAIARGRSRFSYLDYPSIPRWRFELANFIEDVEDIARDLDEAKPEKRNNERGMWIEKH